MRHRRATRLGVDQLVERFEQTWLRLDRRLCPSSRGPAPIRHLDASPNLVHRLVDRRRAHLRRLGHTSLSSTTQRLDHRTGHHPLLALVEVRHHRLEELGKTLRRQLHAFRLPLACYSMVDPKRRAVVGVVTATRNAALDIGGWATPVRSVADQSQLADPGVTDELLNVATEVLEANQAAVMADRFSWHSVIPIDGASQVLSQSWGEYRKSRRADPADLLLAEFRVVPYMFREVELDTAEEWCLGQDRVAVAVAAARGGAGKSRFGVELCKRMIDTHGWVAGELRDLTDHSEVAELPLPRLVVVDYAELVSPETLRSLLEQLTLNATPIAPARVLLLIRERAGFQRGTDFTVTSISNHATASVKLVLNDRDVVDRISDVLDTTQTRGPIPSFVAILRAGLGSERAGQ